MVTSPEHSRGIAASRCAWALAVRNRGSASTLSVPEPAVNIAGDYRLTFTADSACTRSPDIARARSYRVSVTAQPIGDRSSVPGYDVTVVGASMLGTLTGFPIGVAGNRLSFWLHGRHDPAIVEDLGENTYLGFSGNAEATIAAAGAATITTTFDGWIEHVALRVPLVQWYFPLPQARQQVQLRLEQPSHHVDARELVPAGPLPIGPLPLAIGPAASG